MMLWPRTSSNRVLTPTLLAPIRRPIGWLLYAARGVAPLCGPQNGSIVSHSDNRMAESFAKTIKRDYVSWMSKPDVRTALQYLAIAFNRYTSRIRTAP
jgi:hypothetical protein